MVQNLNPNEIYQFIVSDFRGAWDSIADNYNQSIGRGNFMFAFQAMNLLELFILLFIFYLLINTTAITRTSKFISYTIRGRVGVPSIHRISVR
jgi:hypothetical protein